MRGSNVRLVVALVVASTLGAALIYSTVLGGTVDVVQVQQVLAAKTSPGDVRLNGTVVSHEGDAASAGGMRIQLADNRPTRTMQRPRASSRSSTTAPCPPPSATAARS